MMRLDELTEKEQEAIEEMLIYAIAEDLKIPVSQVAEKDEEFQRIEDTFGAAIIQLLAWHGYEAAKR